MNGKFLMCASLTALLFGAACSKSNEAKITSEKRGVEVEYSFSQRSDLVSKMKSQLSDVNSEIEKLSTKAANSGDSAKSDAKAKIETLKEKAKNLNVQIDRAENATEATWNDIKAGSKKAMDEVKDSFRDAREWLSEKVSR